MSQVLSQSIVTRFAPSPTGHLHLGHLYAAQIARDFAAERGGIFLLRHEDIDTTRVRPHFYTEIEEDLSWMGIKWHGEALRQSTRLDHYLSALEELKDKQLVYPCFCTRKDVEQEISSLQSAPHGPEGPLYPGTCRSLHPEQINQKLAANEIPSWRLDAARAQEVCGHLSFSDLRHGHTQVIHGILGDIILARKDIGTSYHIAVVIDDAFQNVSHVTRGDDLFHATHLHRVLQHLLHLPEPTYLHHALIADISGQRLAKRHASLSIRSLRAQGFTPRQILQLLDNSRRVQ